MFIQALLDPRTRSAALSGGSPTPAPGAPPASAAPPAPAPTPAPAVPPAPAAAWWQGKVDEATAGYFKNRGWDGKSADEVAILAANAHREAEKFIGAPADKLVRLPAQPNDEAGWREVYSRLHAVAEGRREVWLRIQAYLNLSSEQLAAVHQGKVIFPPEDEDI